MTLLAVRRRSGLVEAGHQGAVAVMDGTGGLVAWAGDIDRPFFIRSAAKPFQAAVSQAEGAGLVPLQLAVAAGSHDGEAVHVSLVMAMLAEAGLSEADLGCPPARPLRLEADRRLARGGDMAPRRLLHNCSGNHAAMLRACRARGWDSASYLSADHPLQRRVAEVMAEVSGMGSGPPGVDGCGAPVWRTTARALAAAFATLGSDPDLAEVRRAMTRYPAIVSGTDRVDGEIGRRLGVPAKGGAEGCLGVAVAGLGIGIKCWDGSGGAAGVAAVAVLAELGLVGDLARERLGEVAQPVVWGGGREVGRMSPVVALQWA